MPVLNAPGDSTPSTSLSRVIRENIDPRDDPDTLADAPLTESVDIGACKGLSGQAQNQATLHGPMNRLATAADPSVGVSREAPRTHKAPGELEARATGDSEQQADFENARQIYANMAAERRLSEEKIRAIWADVQTEIFRIWQEVMLRRQKVLDDLLDKWAKILFG